MSIDEWKKSMTPDDLVLELEPYLKLAGAVLTYVSHREAYVLAVPTGESPGGNTRVSTLWLTKPITKQEVLDAMAHIASCHNQGISTHG